MRLSLTLFILLILSTLSYGQLKIDAASRIGVASEPDELSRMYVENDALDYSFFLRTEPNTSGTWRGLLHHMVYGTLGNRRGLENSVYGDGSYYNYPLINYGKHEGTGKNYSFINYAYHYGSGENIGIYNKLWHYGSGMKTGIYTELGDDRSENASSTAAMYGSRTLMTHRYRPRAYGSYLDIEATNYNSSSNATYGYYVKVNPYYSNKSPAYGVYSVMTRYKEGEYYAGYFTGDLAINGVIVQTSDATLKDKIEDITSALSLINQLHPTTYHFQEGNRFGYDPNDQRFGFLAQEVEKVFPSLVQDVHHPEVVRPASVASPEEMDAVLGDSLATRNDESKRHPEEIVHPAEVLKGINYIDFIPILTQAIKEQQIEIAALKRLTGELLDKPLIGSVLGDQGQSSITSNADTNQGDRKSSKSTVKEAKQLTIQVQHLTEQNEQLVADLSSLRAELATLRQQLAQLQNCTDCTGSSTPKNATLSDGRVSIYPNPASNKVTVNNSVVQNYSVRVLTADGREYARLNSQDWVVQINIADWPTGTYIFETLAGDVVLDRQTVVVSR